MRRLEERGFVLGKELVASTVVGRASVLADAFAMLRCGIARIVVPTIERELFVKFLHIVVAVSFGQDRGGCYRLIFPIAFDDSLVWRSAVGEKFVAVDDDKFGTYL